LLPSEIDSEEMHQGILELLVDQRGNPIEQFVKIEDRGDCPADRSHQGHLLSPVALKGDLVAQLQSSGGLARQGTQQLDLVITPGRSLWSSDLKDTQDACPCLHWQCDDRTLED
jgi:hypothetical protein